MESQKFSQKVSLYRGLAAFSIILSIMNIDLLDSQLIETYSWLREQWWFKHDSFEPMWATFSFTIWVLVYNIIDNFFLDSFRKYLVNPKGRVTENDYTEKLQYYTAAAYLAPILLYDVFFPRRVLQEDAPTFFQFIGGIALAVFLYDLFFYPIHYLLHKGPNFLQKLHKEHHKESPLTSKEVIRHSFVDGTLQVFTNILVLNLLKLHPMTRMFYNSVITYLLTETHSGYDMPWMLHNLLPKGVLGGPNRHELHHKNGRVNYHQFFTYFDNLLGHGSDNLKVQ